LTAVPGAIAPILRASSRESFTSLPSTAVMTSPAAEHGFKTGDVILDVAGKTVSKPQDVRQELANLRQDGKHTVLMRLKSGDATKFVAVPLAKA
jgi:S1-C subfamily serine protease